MVKQGKASHFSEPPTTGSSIRFVVGISIALAVSFVFLALIGSNKSVTSLAPGNVLPQNVYAYLYDEQESSEAYDQMLMGLSPLEASLSYDLDGTQMFRYSYCGKREGDKTGKSLVSGHIESAATVLLDSFSNSQLEYRISPNTDVSPDSAGKWSAYLRVPRKVDPEHPSGTWILCVASSSGKWKRSTWVQANPDGTGTFGCLDDDVDKVDAHDRGEASSPCTVSYEQNAAGDRVLVEFEGGKLVLAVPKGGDSNTGATVD